METLLILHEHSSSMSQQSQGMVNTHLLPDNIKLFSKCNLPGAGRLLSYPAELDDELLKWIFVLRDLHFPVSVISFQEKAKHVIQPHNLSFLPAEDGFKSFSGDTKCCFVLILRSVRNFQSSWKTSLANFMRMLHVLCALESTLCP